MRPLRVLASLSLTFALLVNATPASAVVLRRIDAVSFSDAQRGWISGGFSPRTGFVSYTSDGGQHWRTMTKSDRWYYGVEADGPSSVWALSNSEDRVSRSTDGGATWTETSRVLTSDGTNLRGAVQLGSRTTVFGQDKNSVYGEAAFIASSVDGGDTWTRQYEGPTYESSNEASDAPRAIADMVAGDVATSGAAAWVVGNEWKPIDIYTDSIVYKAPLIFKSTDGGSSWTTQTPPATLTGGWPLTGLAVGSQNVAFVAAAGTRSLGRTTNGGTLWETWQMPRKSPFTSPIARTMDAWGENILVVGGSGGLVAWSDWANTAPSNTTDATHWRYFKLPNGANVNSVQVVSTSTAIAVGDEETLAKTTDAGWSWQMLPSGPPAASVTGPSPFQLTMAPMTISGVATDTGVGVADVDVRIRRADGQCFNGIGWTATETWLQATTADGWDHWTYDWTPDAALLASGQMVTVSAKTTDGVGQTSISTGITSSAPISASVSLAGGSPYSTTTNVAAAISAAGANSMRWTVDGGVTYSPWQAYSSTANVTLPSGDGTKTASFQFSTAAYPSGSYPVAAIASDSIVVHTSLPQVAITSPSTGFGTAGAVNITGTASDAGGTVSRVEVRIRRGDGQTWNGTTWTTSDSWITAGGTTTWSYSWTPVDVGTQAVTVQARAMDMANLFSNPIASVTSAGVVEKSVLLNDGAAYASTSTVSAAVSAGGATHMRWRVDGEPYSAWTAFSATKNVAVSGEGTHTVRFEFSPDAGATSLGTAEDSIVLHTSVPEVAFASPADGFRLTQAPVTISGTATDTGLGLEKVELLLRRSDGKSWDTSTKAWVDEERWFTASMTPTTSPETADWTYRWEPGVSAVETDDIVTLSVRATDLSGLSRRVDRTSGTPVRATASLADGATYATSATVKSSVGLNADPSGWWYRYSVNGKSVTTTWTPFTAEPMVNIAGTGEGTKTVTFQFSSDQETSAVEASDSIFLDSLKPTISLTAPPDKFGLTDPPLFTGSAVDNGSGVAGVEVCIKRADNEYWNGVGWQGVETWVDATLGYANVWSYDWNPDAATKTGYLPVTVVARAKDKAGNTSSNSPIVNSEDRLDPTKVTLTSSSATLSYGGTGYVKGKLTKTLTEQPFSGARVYLYAGSTSSSVKRTTIYTTTDANGNFSFRTKPSSRTYYKVRFDASAGHAASVSGAMAFTPKAYLTTPYAPSTARRNVTFGSYGYLKPRHSAGSYPVRIYLYRYVNGSYRYYRYVNAKAYNYSSYTKYVGSVKFPYAGKWRIRAYHSDSGHATSISSYRYVTVR